MKRGLSGPGRRAHLNALEWAIGRSDSTCYGLSEFFNRIRRIKHSSTYLPTGPDPINATCDRLKSNNLTFGHSSARGHLAASIEEIKADFE